MTSQVSKPSLWKNRDYMLLWSGQVVSTLGSSVSNIIYPLLILELTGSPASAGITSALSAVPYVLLSLPVGALVDRWDRKRVMILCDWGRFLILASITISLFLNVLTVWQIYLSTLLEGSFFVVFNLAEVAALPRVVGRNSLPQAAAQNEAAMSTAQIVGPSLGTFLYQSLGRMAPFLMDTISFAASATSLMFVKTQFQEERKIVKRELHMEISEGLGWLWKHSLIRYMALLTGACNMTNAAMPLICIVLAKQMGADDAQIGLIFSISGIGGIIGSLIGGQIQKRFSFGQVIIGVMWVQALVFPLFLFAPKFLFLGVISGLISLCGPIYNVVQYSYRISIIPDHLQGRVNATFRLVAFGFNPIGAALSGFLLEKFGAGVAIGFFGLWYVLFAALTNMNKHVRNARPIS